jgi:hypothetical protein
MMSDSDKFGDGIMAAFFFAVILVVAAFIGVAIESTLITSDCNDFGKVHIRTTWYECKPVEQKK